MRKFRKSLDNGASPNGGVDHLEDPPSSAVNSPRSPRKGPFLYDDHTISGYCLSPSLPSHIVTVTPRGGAIRPKNSCQDGCILTPNWCQKLTPRIHFETAVVSM